MRQQIELPNKITRADLNTGTRQLKSIVSSEQPFALPLILRGRGQLGIIGSLDSTLSFFEQNKIALSNVLHLKQLEQHLDSLTKGNEAALVTLGQNKHGDAAGFVFYRGALCEELSKHACAYTNGNGAKPLHSFPIVTDLNIDHPAVERVLSRELRGGLKSTTNAVDNGGITAQKNAEFAVLNRENALRLKARMFPEDGNIIKRATASQVNQKFGSLKGDIDENRTFIRVDLTNRWGNVTERNLTLVPGYAVEFLELDEAGRITGVKPGDSSLRLQFHMQAQVDTDFTGTTRFRINSSDAGKLAIVERAMTQLRKGSGYITLQGQKKAAEELTKERRLCGTQGHIKFDSPIGVSFTLHASGKTEDLCIGSGRQNALIKHALSLPKNVSMIFKGRNYSFGLG
ncbi:MAG: hypothetical protein R3E13_10190 [Alphaproteobacteria bacterium]